MRAGTPESWMRQLRARLDGAGPCAQPLQPLLAEFLRLAPTPQHLFDGIKLLIERGELALDEDEGRLLLAPVALPRSRHNPLSRGDLVQLAAAIAAAGGYVRTAPRAWAQPEGIERSLPPIQARPGRRVAWRNDVVAFE